MQLGFVESSGDPTWAVDLDGKILAWNEAACRTFGYHRSEALGKNSWEILAGRDKFGNRYCCPSCPVRFMAACGEPIRSCDLVFCTAGGERVSLTLQSFVLGTGTPDPVVVHTGLMPRPGIGDANGNKRANPGTTPGPRLTRRERQVLSLLAEGKNTREMARQLLISPTTVRHHIQSIHAKLKVHSRIEAVSLARRLGML